MAGRFITISIHRNEYDDVNHYMSSVTAANIVLSAAFSIVAMFILTYLGQMFEIPGGIVRDVTLLWGLLFFGFFITLIGGVFDVATFAHNRLDLAAIRDAISGVLRAIVLFGMYYLLSPNVWYMGFVTVVCNLYIVCMNIHYTKRFMPYVEIRKKHIDIKMIITLVSSGIWNSLSKLSSILSTGLDLLITNIFVGASAMGVVSIAKVIPTYILSIFGTISNVFAPQLTISYAKEDVQDIKKQLYQAIKLLSFIAAIPTSCYVVFGGDFFSLWLPTQNADVLHLLGILSSAAFFFSLALEPLWNIFTVTNKVKISSLFLFFNSVVTIAITYILLHFAQSELAKMCIVCGVSTVFSIVRTLTFLPIYGAKCLGLKWYTFYGTIGKVAVANCIAVLIAILIKNIGFITGWGTLALAVIVTAVFICVINYLLILNKQERKLLLQVLKRR